MIKEISVPQLQIGVSKSDIVQIASQVIYNVIENGSELEFSEAISANENLIKEIKASKEFTEAVRSAVERYGKNYITSSGAKIENCEVGTKYDYSQCNDSELAEMEQRKNTLEALIKARQDFLKSIPAAGIELLDNKTGELVNIYPPAKSSTSSYKVTLCK